MLFSMGRPVGGKQQKRNWNEENYPITSDIIREPGLKVTNPLEIAFLQAVEANDVNKVKEYAKEINLKQGNVFKTAIIIATQKHNKPMIALIKKLRDTIATILE